MTAQGLLDTLECLENEEFKVFKWHLKQRNTPENCQPIKASKLEEARRQDTVDLMVNTYTLDGALTVTKKVLEKINRNDLVQNLSVTSSGPEGSTATETPQRNVPAEERVPAEPRVPAEQRLLSVRKEFVDRVSNPVLNQLLDKLLECCIINDQEMESVITKAVKTEKARVLIDMVRKKGTDQSSVMIDALREVDPLLCRQLNLG